MDGGEKVTRGRLLSPRKPCKYAALGVLGSAVILYYNYTYATLHDPSIQGAIHYLFQKQYRPLQTAVSLFPIAVGYYFGRAREEIVLSRQNAELLRRLVAQQQTGTRDVLADPGESSQATSCLTKREKEVLTRVARGRSNKEIALDLHLSELTVKTHMRNIFQKLEINDRTTAAVIALRDGLLD